MAALPPPEPPVYPPAGPRWPPHPPTHWPPPTPPPPAPSRRGWWVVVTAVLAVALIAVLVARDTDDDRADPVPDTTVGLPEVTPPPGGPPSTVDPGLGGAGLRVGIAVPGPVRTLNPHRADDSPDVREGAITVANQILPSAFLHQPDGTWTLDPAVVSTAEVTRATPFTVRYSMADEARWSDGQPVGCADFLLAWVAIAGDEPSFSPGRPSSPIASNPDTVVYRAIADVRCAGAEITVEFTRPVAEWRMLFAHLLPAHAVAAVANVEDVVAALRGRDLDDLRPLAAVWNDGFGVGVDPRLLVSAGPFTVTDVMGTGEVRLQRNDRYGGRPAPLDGLVLRPFTDYSGLPSALARGDVQVAQLGPNPDLARQIDALASYAVTPVATHGFVELSFVFPTADGIVGDARLADPAVRRAVALCVDRQAAVDRLVHAFVPDADTADSHLLAPGEPGYTPSAGRFARRDVAAARAELDRAGWVIGPDGVYTKDGEPLRLDLVHSSSARESALAELMQEGCADAGIAVEPRLAAQDNDYGALRLQRWGPYNSVETNLSRFEADGLINNSHYANPELAPLFDAVRAAGGDLDALASAVATADAALWEDAASVPLYPAVSLVTWDARLCGVVPNPTAVGVTWNAGTWEPCAAAGGGGGGDDGQGGQPVP